MHQFSRVTLGNTVINTLADVFLSGINVWMQHCLRFQREFCSHDAICSYHNDLRV